MTALLTPACQNPTARELAGTERGLEVFAFLLDEVIDANDNPLAYGQVVVFIDNKSAARALRLGSANMDVHRRVQAVFQRAAVAGIDILSRWRPRDTQLVQEADDGSKWVDNCDYRLDTDVVHNLDAGLTAGRLPTSCACAAARSEMQSLVYNRWSAVALSSVHRTAM